MSSTSEDLQYKLGTLSGNNQGYAVRVRHLQWERGCTVRVRHIFSTSEDVQHESATSSNEDVQ